MEQLHKLYENPAILQKLSQFLSIYGTESLEEAIDHFVATQEDYICKTKSSITRLKISDIYYLQIQGHQITIHTQENNYKKYGSLANEIKVLSNHGFIRCNQSCIVASSKIKEVDNNQLNLLNGHTLHMIRSYASNLLMAFYGMTKK